MTIFEYIITVLTKFGGGGGGPPNDLVRFGLAAIFFAILFGVAWSRQRRGNYPRERLLVWGFGLGFVRELFMFTIVSLIIAGDIEQATLEIFFPPFEHAVRGVAVVLIAGAFLRYILDDASIAHRYLRVWVSMTVACYLVVFWPWAQAVRVDPMLRFGMHWGDWLFRIAGVISLAIPMVLLTRAQGWVRNVAIVALSGFFLDDFLMLINLASAEAYAPIYGPIRHNLHLWAIPLLGYVYFREQANELQAADAALKIYSEQLEGMVATRTAELEQRTIQLEQQAAELERAKDAAEVASHAKSEFLSNMNHELRSPLNAILGFTRITAHSDGLPQDLQENLGIVMRSGEHLLTLINQVLDLAKIEAGRATLSLGTFDLTYFLHTLEEMFALTADTKGLQLQIAYTPNLPQLVQADEVKLRQVLINLLSNALKFTEQGRIILQVTDCGVSTTASGTNTEAEQLPDASDGQGAIHTLRFDVIDTGPGIAANEQERIFETFAQTTLGEQAEEGTGLGLPISRSFVQLMGGNLTVESPVRPPNSLAEREGQQTQPKPGARFSFTIPVTARTGEYISLPTAKAEDRVSGLAPDQPTYRILVVDDKAVNRQLLLKLLVPLGFAVREAANGKEAIMVWEEWHPHLIWMDMRMPVLDGYEATTRIKATTQGQATVVIALTASAFEEERAIVLSAGCDDFMRKPFREADIFAVMAQQLGVRYQYATDRRETTVGTIDLPQQEIATALHALPVDIQYRLKDAVATVDIEALESVIQQITPLHQGLATDLAHYAQAYDYEQLERLLEQATNG